MASFWHGEHDQWRSCGNKREGLHCSLSTVCWGRRRESQRLNHHFSQCLALFLGYESAFFSLRSVCKQLAWRRTWSINEDYFISRSEYALEILLSPLPENKHLYAFAVSSLTVLLPRPKGIIFLHGTGDLSSLLTPRRRGIMLSLWLGS